jgi:deoxyribodipyrimidine photo-lyase
MVDTAGLHGRRIPVSLSKVDATGPKTGTGAPAMKTTAKIDDTRIHPLNDQPVAAGGGYVLYWMQQSQRADDNHALEYAVQQANALKHPLVAVFGLTADYPEANLRHYRFMLQGLKETKAALARRGIELLILPDTPHGAALSLARNAAMVVCDRGYLRQQKKWRQQVARRAACPVVEVETDVVVPVETVSGKAEYAARTIRPRIHRHLGRYLVRLRKTALERPSPALKIIGIDLTDIDRVLARMDLDRRVAPVPFFRGGPAAARRCFGRFLKKNLNQYDDRRSRPETDVTSTMSPYLHFGHISPLFLALRVLETGEVSQSARDAFIEELVVRRELACNFVYFTPNYDHCGALPRWARTTLEAHAGDRRPHRYTPHRLEAAKTHDPYWNAAMDEMKYTGYMHGYMRMYWGKKILEWSRDWWSAFHTILTLNNKYFIDGRDPNSYTGAGWIFGLHDRAWFERPIFGKVRYMAASGLERKADPKAYVEKVEKRVAEARRVLATAQPEQ